MGDQVGQLLFGTKINYEDVSKLKKKFNIRYLIYLETNDGISGDTPYETEEYFIKISDKECNFNACNGSEFIGNTLPETNLAWSKKIEDFCKKHEISYSKIGWFLIGHYN